MYKGSTPFYIKKEGSSVWTVAQLKEITTPSAHLQQDRAERYEHIAGRVIRDVFKELSDKCKYGPILHYITDQAEDLIVDPATGKIITVRACRPHQLEELYRATHRPVPRDLALAAWINKQSGSNLI